MPRSTLLLLPMLLLAACGSSGRSDGDERRAPTPTAVATGTPTPVSSATPEPSASPTAEPAFDEILLGIGARYGSVQSNGARAYRPLVLRNAGSGWTEVHATLPLRDGGFLIGVTFSSPTRAWLYGGRNESFDGVLFRSDNGGASWVDVSNSLPSDCQAIADLEFIDAETGYLVSHGFFATAYFSTTDGGRTWHSIDVPTGAALSASYAVGTRDAAPEVVRNENGLAVLRLDDPTGGAMQLAPPGETRIFNGNAFATAGTFGWIAATAPTRPNDSVHTRAAVFTSTTPGAAWNEQPIDPQPGFPELWAIDVRDQRNGIAGGVALDDAEDGYAAFALVLDANGASWHDAPIAGLPPGWVIRDLLRTRGEGAWAIANSRNGDSRGAFVRSDDGGRNWQVDDALRFQDVDLFDLARNTSVP